MSESIYAPPEADVAPPSGDGPRYYVVSPLKFLLLSVLTFELYFVYWFYRNWRQIKLADNDDIWPPARGFFYIFFTHSLLSDVDANLVTKGKSYEWSPALIAGTFVIITVASNMLSRFVDTDTYSWLDIVTMGSTFVLAFILLRAQKAINFVSDDVGGTSNASLTAANWAWMILGGLLWLLTVSMAYLDIFNPTFLES